MKNILRKRAVFSLICSFVLILAVLFIITSRNSAQQAPALSLVSNQPPVETAHAVKTEAPKTLVLNSAFALAASRNLELRSNIAWTFGGKAQRGWSLYQLLIGELIGNESAVNEDFAAALSEWQKSAGLQPTGILDNDSLFAMVKTWQSRRLNSSIYPSPDELQTAPSTDFWDPSRPEELRQLERETYAAYKRMVAAAVADKTLNLKTNPDGSLADGERFLKIISAFRSREYQMKLRQASPNSGRAGLAVNSPHFTGRALDIYVGGEPVSTKDENRAIQVNTPVYKWLVKNAHKFGFRPYFYEPWHWEYAPGEINHQSEHAPHVPK